VVLVAAAWEVGICLRWRKQKNDESKDAILVSLHSSLISKKAYFKN